MRAAFLVIPLAFALLAGCKSLPDKPVRQTMYDFGPVPALEAPTATTRAPLLLRDVEPGGVLESTALLYRLAYDDPNELRAYAYARWSAPPAELVTQRLQHVLGRERAVLDNAAATALARRGAAAPPVLRVELEEFSHVFDTKDTSRGVLRLRVTLLENTPAGERLVGQRMFVVQRTAPTNDAAGGVRALAAATEAAAREVADWLRQR